MKVAVYGFPAQYNHSEYIQEFFSQLTALKAEVLIHEPFHRFLKEALSFDERVHSFSRHEEIKGSDFLFSLGGDGTFLKTIDLVRDSGIPIIGINTGRLGFLASIAKEEIAHALQQIVNKKYTLEKRSLIAIESPSKIFADNNFALNEITILKKDSSSMITINAYLDGEFLNSYWADGLIIATPTGSTAYSLSCGGPIVLPVCHNLVITPIAPHNLNVRPLVVPDTSVITLKMEVRDSNYLVALDAAFQTSDSSMELTIKKAKFEISVVKLEGQNFFNTMRNKLMWGLDKRN